MTATERLRALLDERGVEWTRGRYDRREFTRWYIRNNSGFIAASFRDVLADGNEKPYLRCEFYHITPEQAITATLGRGTCKDVAEFRGFGTKTEFKCSACGYEYSAVGGFGCDYGDEPDFNFCPNCGRMVES